MPGNRVVNTDLDFINVGRIRQLLDGVDPQDAATVAQLESVQSGLAWKDSARVATDSNINLSSPGSALDGVTMVVGDRALVTAQTSAPQNGIYIWNGASTAMARAPDALTFEELEQAVVTVEEGTSAGVTLRQTQVNGTIGTDDVLWTSFGAAVPDATTSVAGKIEIATQGEVDAGTATNLAVTPETLAGYGGFARRYSTAFGDGAATSYTITHNLGTRAVVCAVALTGSPYDTVECEIENTSTSTVVVKVNTAPTSNQYTITVLG